MPKVFWTISWFVYFSFYLIWKFTLNVFDNPFLWLTNYFCFCVRIQFLCHKLKCFSLFCYKLVISFLDHFLRQKMELSELITFLSLLFVIAYLNHRICLYEGLILNMFKILCGSNFLFSNFQKGLVQYSDVTFYRN